MTDEEAWASFYRETVEPLYRYVSRLAGRARSLAEDVTQESYLRALARFRPGARPDVPLAWLKTVARNLVRTHFRRAGSIPAEGDVERLLAPDADAGRAPAEAVASLQSGLSRLRDREARLVEGFHLEGRTVRDLAAEHGLSERAVEGRLRRARRRLRTLLTRENGS